MTTKILRKFFRVVYWILFCILTIHLFLGESTIFRNITLAVYCMYIAFKIKDKIYYNKIFKSYKYHFDYLQSIHKQRYYLYFSGTESEVKRYFAHVEDLADTVLVSGELMLRDRNASKKQCEEIQKIIEKTKRLKENIQPPV